MGNLLFMTLNCNANIQNNTLTETHVSWVVYYLQRKTTIQLNNIVFTRNSLMARLLQLVSISTPVIQNNTLTENNVSSAVYGVY